MMCHKICFYGDIWIIIPKLSLLLLLIWSTDNYLAINLVSLSQNGLDEIVLMMGHKIYFYGEIWIIIPKLSLLLLLIWSTDNYLATYLVSTTETQNSINNSPLATIFNGTT